MSHLEGPNVFTPKPSGIQKVRKTPLFLAAGCFCFVLVFLVFKMSARQKDFEEKRKVKAHPPVLAEVPTQSLWFEDAKYDDIRRSFPQERLAEKPSSTGEQKKSPPAADTLPVLPEGERREDDRQKEIDRAEMELQRMEQQARIEARRQYFEAIKSPGISASMGNISHAPSGENSDFRNPAGSSDGAAGQTTDLLSYGASTGQAEADQNMQKSKQQFLSAGVTSSHYLPHGKQKPLSRYEIKAGTVIPAALIQGINSDLPGNVTAMVRENVYDTVSGRYRLIPQGSKLIGQYDSKLSFGQNRLLIVWTRLIFPDGSSLDLQKMQGIDMAGYAGFKDRVDYHYLRIYGNALLLSVLGAGYEFLDPQKDRTDTSETVAANIGRELAQTTSRMTEKNINIQPTIIIRPGYKFNVLVMKDMILENLNDRPAK